MMSQFVSVALSMTLLSVAQALSSCDRVNMQLQSKKIETFTSVGYPGPYPGGIKKCNFTGVSPVNHRIIMYCDHFDVENSRNCSNAYLTFSPTGDPQNLDGKRFCGTRDKLSMETTSNSFSVSFDTFHANNGKKTGFRCYIVAVPETITQPGVSTKRETTTTTTSTTSTPPPAPTPPEMLPTVAPENCNCGVKKMNLHSMLRVVGGKESSVNEYPWMAALKYKTGDQFCGGSMIDHQWVLTASHCVDGQKADRIQVVLGEHDLSTQIEAPSVTLDVEEIVMHEKYNERTVDNDIALIKLSRPVEYTAIMGPVCLPYRFQDNHFVGKMVTLTGWGKTSGRHFASPSDKLLELDIPVLSNAECRKYEVFGQDRLTDNMICTYKQNQDSCQGDSGGPLTYEYEGKHYQIGIVSWGFGCAKEMSPGVYSKVNNYLAWIDGKIGKTLCNNS